MNNFTYLQPETLEVASQLLKAEDTHTLPYAGGTDALDLIKTDIIAPERVVNLKKIPNLNKIEYTSGKGLRIGALVTITELAEHKLPNEKYTIISEAAKEIASPQLRNVGTIGGNICQRPRCYYYREEFDCIRKGGDICYAYQGHNKLHCIIGGGPCYIVHPSDMAVALLALKAKAVIFSNGKSRTIPISDFFVLPEKDYLHENILRPGEIITEFQIPDLLSNTRSGYLKFKERAVWDFAVASVAAVIQKNGDIIQSGRVAFGGVAPTPWQEELLNQKLIGLSANENAIDRWSKNALKKAEPLSMNSYKIQLSQNLLKRLVTRLAS
jgi:xanthine dehydrogenase YagS FAD-binding subunit